ncbi:zinc-dependent metalloprotease [Mesoterricola silvestris]|uniref:DUF5117 domain-containing protein n=1 Tax=Mesoterricola silvestris TaxID=2927979 RepID=A0AA48GNG3_9BACT|nr:zinc-dependent metalloprotease [Mesoterricola silvestris]BDU73109.1 hypothetical protein METEAL_22830 [Mesoterricola silvestris]
MKPTVLALVSASAAFLSADPPPAPVPQPPISIVMAKEAPVPLKPYADVVQGAREQRGLFTLWRKDDKVWIDLKPEQLGPLFFLSWTFPSGLGERGIYGGMMGDSHLVYFKRIGNNLQLLAHNSAFTARPGTPMAHAVADGFSDSLLASAPVVSLPDPRGKGVLVEANLLFLKDLPMATLDLEAAFRQPYAMDLPNSSFASATAAPDYASFQVSAHFSMARPVISAAPLPGTLEDLRSLFLGFRYTLAKLPGEPMRPREADDRVGHFVATVWDFTQDDRPDPRIRLVNRWRLEKADPGAPLSRPKHPIVFWMDRNIPEKYRDAVRAGILEWNKAFERIGYKDALEVRQTPDDADPDAHGLLHASIRWFLGVDAGFAIGPSLVDPRTGEILAADIAVGDGFARSIQESSREELPQAGKAACRYLAEGRDELAFGADLLEARGGMEPGTPGAQAFVQAYLKSVVMHEVGHTLGLRHNFRASIAYTEAQLGDKAFTDAHGIAGSVMDYTPVNLALAGHAQGDYTMATLGPYDYWAIEYAYADLAPDREKADLARIAARSETDPLLAYATDEEAGPGIAAMDPEVNRFDLGQDPLAYLAKRIALSHELLDRLQERTFRPGDDFRQLRRTTSLALNQMATATFNAAKYLGGVVCLRDHAGSARAPMTPVPGARQRAALKLITGSIFTMDALRLRPEFVSRLVVDPFDRGYGPVGSFPDFSVSARTLSIQKAVLARVLNPFAMARILDAPEKTRDKDVFRLSELFDGLHAAIWEELHRGSEPTATRRGLQKEHLRQLIALVLRANPATPDDARALAREELELLRRQLATADRRPGLSRETRAHIAECRATVDSALKASMQRASL